MGKDQELLEAARSGNVTVVEKILGQRAKRSGPLARWVSPYQTLLFLASFPVYAFYNVFYAIPLISYTPYCLNYMKNCLDVCQFIERLVLRVHVLFELQLLIIRASMIKCLYGIDCTSDCFLSSDPSSTSVFAQLIEYR